MPEGDTIFRSALRLRQVLPGRRIEAAGGNGRYVDAESLVDGLVTQVEARGKHLLMHLEDGRVIHSHMGMTGSWHTYPLGEPWRKSPRWAGLSLQMARATEPDESPIAARARQVVVVCFSPKLLELLTPAAFRRHRYLRQLGPDLMLDPPDQQTVIQRFRVHNLAAIGEAVMNQTIVSGIGNVYKSETLFLTGQDPFARVQTLSDDRIVQITRCAQTLMHKNLIGYPRRTRTSSDQHRLWVYGRSGQPCLRCAARVRMRRQGDLGRSTYWCPACQLADD